MRKNGNQNTGMGFLHESLRCILSLLALLSRSVLYCFTFSQSTRSLGRRSRRGGESERGREGRFINSLNKRDTYLALSHDDNELDTSLIPSHILKM